MKKIKKFSSSSEYEVQVACPLISAFTIGFSSSYLFLKIALPVSIIIGLASILVAFLIIVAVTNSWNKNTVSARVKPRKKAYIVEYPIDSQKYLAGYPIGSTFYILCSGNTYLEAQEKYKELREKRTTYPYKVIGKV